MTSEYTKDMTVSFFQSHSHFGLSPSNIVTFEQDTLPCLDFTGKILMDQKYHISRAPDGNGGLYLALRKNNILKVRKEVSHYTMCTWNIHYNILYIVHTHTHLLLANVY